MSADPDAAVLIIGDEILSGRTADTNLNTLARFLGGLGVELKEARVVADDRDAIVEAIRALTGRRDYVFSTGGIGPTHDDITAECVAQAMGAPLRRHPEADALLRARYGEDYNAARQRMARIPEGASLIRNPVTDAPGFQIGNLFVMAGVPKIMAAMLEDVGPRLRRGRATVAVTLRVDRVGEGVLAQPLAEIAAAFPELSLGSYPFGSGTDGFGAHLVVRGKDSSTVEEAALRLSEELAALGVISTRLPG